MVQTIERKIKKSGLKNIQIIQGGLKPAIEGLARAEKENFRKFLYLTHSGIWYKIGTSKKYEVKLYV